MAKIVKEIIDREKLIPFLKQSFMNRNFGDVNSQKHACSIVSLLGDATLESKDLTKYILAEIGMALIDSSNKM